MISRGIAAAFLLIASGVGCAPPDPEEGRAQSTSELYDLGSVRDFQARFDADSAFPRLVLLISPT